MKAPLPFLLVRHATRPASEHQPDYTHLLQAVRAKELHIDHLACHAGQWILDCAIQWAIQSPPSTRQLAKHHGAHPDMDALWANWASSASVEVVGTPEQHADRLARLCRLGSSVCLDVLLSRFSLPAASVQAAWQTAFPFPKSGLFVSCIQEDFLSTVKVLIKHGWNPNAFEDREENAYMHATSPAMVEVLLSLGAAPARGNEAKAGNILDRISQRALSAATKARMVELLRDSGQVIDSEQQKQLRLVHGLDKKSKEQFSHEASSLGWSPSRRGQLTSPLIDFVRSALMAEAPIGNEGAIEWLSRQPSFSHPLHGQQWSEAAWLTAGHMVNNPTQASRYAAQASDLPDELPWARLRWFEQFLLSESLLPNLLARAVDALLGHLAYEKKEDIPQALENLFTPSPAAAWILGRYLSTNHRSGSALCGFFDAASRKGLNDPLLSSRCLSLGVVMFRLGQSQPAELGEMIELLWEKGTRPLPLPCDRRLVLMEGQPGLPSSLQARLCHWDIDMSSRPALASRSSPRL